MRCPDHAWLIETLFAYDVVGFQTSSDVTNFQRYVLEQADGVLKAGGQISAFGRTIVVRNFPIGIDVDAIKDMAHTPKADASIQLLATRTLNRAQIIGVDRLDYTKGLPDRFRAFRRLLELYPEHLKRVILMQIAPPTREEVAAYVDIREELEGLSGNINGEFGDFDWTPVRYIHRSIERDILAALVPRQQGRPGDAAARRHEPGGEGIRRGAGRRRSRRADPVALRGRRRRSRRGTDRQSLRHGRCRHRHAARTEDAARGAHRTPPRLDRAASARATSTHWREQFLTALTNSQQRYAA